MNMSESTQDEFLWMTRPDRDCVYVQDSAGGMVRERYWEPLSGDAWSSNSVGFSCLVWVLEVLLDPTHAFSKAIAWQAGELLGLGGIIFYHPERSNRYHAPQYIFSYGASYVGCDRWHYVESLTWCVTKRTLQEALLFLFISALVVHTGVWHSEGRSGRVRSSCS